MLLENPGTATNIPSLDIEEKKGNAFTKPKVIHQESSIFTIDSKAWVRPRGNGISGLQFVVPKNDIEEQTRKKLTKGATFEFAGEVEGVFEFQIKRRISSDRYVHVYVPADRQKALRKGESYRLTLSSIQEVTSFDSTGAITRPSIMTVPHLGTLTSKAYRGSGKDPAVAFRVRKPRLEDMAGVRFEKDKRYLIKGSIENVCRFELDHRESGYSNYLTITPPVRFASHFTLGERYRILVDYIQQQTSELPKSNFQSAFFWDWKTVAVWIDTEGSIQTYPNTNRAVISQKEKSPLEDIGRFLASEGIQSHIVTQLKDGRVYYQLATEGGIEKLAEFVKNVEPCIVTSNRKKQIANLRAKLAEKPKFGSVRRRRARQILGVA